MSKVNGYQLSRDWFNFAFEKKEAKVQHTALYLWLVELNNRLGWKEEFQLPTLDTMDGLSIGNKLTYLNTLKDLRKWKFIEIVQESKNQYQATVIKLCRNEIVIAQVTALDMALQQHGTQHSNSIDTSIGTGSVPIDKQVNNETMKQEKDIDIKFEITPQGIIEETPEGLLTETPIPFSVKTPNEDVEEDKDEEENVDAPELVVEVVPEQPDRKLIPDPEFIKEGENFVEWFVQNHLPPEIKDANKLKKSWIDTYEKLRRIDKKTKNEIAVATKWARTDEFWQSNFLSPNKLREKNKQGAMYIDVFLVKASESKKKSHNPATDATQGLGYDDTKGGNGKVWNAAIGKFRYPADWTGPKV